MLLEVCVFFGRDSVVVDQDADNQGASIVI